MRNLRRPAIWMAPAVLAVATAAVAAVYFLGSQPASTAGPPEVLYVTTDPQAPAERLDEIGPHRVVISAEEFDAAFEPGHTWAVVYDSADADLLPPGKLQSLFESGLLIVAINSPPRDLRDAIAAYDEGAFADVAAVRPATMLSLGDAMDIDPAFEESYMTFSFRTSVDVYEATGCNLSGGGQRSMDDSWVTVRRAKHAGTAQIQERDGAVRSTCGG